MFRTIVLVALCFVVWRSNAQSFTDITPGNLPIVDAAKGKWADYNNDGYLDFAVMGQPAASTGYGAIFTGSGNGTFTLLANSNMPKIHSGDFDWGDFDNDADLDLAITGRSETSPYTPTIVLRNNITSFDSYLVTDGAWGGAVQWLDYDNDNDLDLYVVGLYINRVFINIDGALSADNAFSVKGYAEDINSTYSATTATDFDRDGDQDLFTTGQYANGVWSNAHMLVNDGVQNIHLSDTYRFLFGDIAVAWGSLNQTDFNRDGLPDYLLSGDHSSINGKIDPFTTVLLGTGGNPTRIAGLQKFYNSSSDVGDIDNDGDVDIVISGNNGAVPMTKVYLNDGLANFTGSSVELLGLQLSSVSLGDFDNDGDLDILMFGRDGAGHRASKLYRNDLKSAIPAPNEKPLPPSGLKYKTENNTLIMSWDSGSDKETSQGSLTYNTYVAIQSGKSFQCFPEADPSTGTRQVFEPGNAYGSKTSILKGLKSGDYFFSVQTVDGVNAASVFATEVAVKFAKIEVDGLACDGYKQTFFVKPAGSYTWAAEGGQIIEGQGIEKIIVQWTKGILNRKVSITGNGISNSYIQTTIPLPDASFTGPNTVCDRTSNSTEYRGTYNDSYSYVWSIDGFPKSTQVLVDVEFSSKGKKWVEFEVTDAKTGCANKDSLEVTVSEPVNVIIERDVDKLTIENQDPTYTYKWEKAGTLPNPIVSTSPSYTVTSPGYYVGTVIEANGCSWSKSYYVQKIITGIDDEIEEVRLFPNPATTSFEIVNLPTDKPSVAVIKDVTGRNVLKQSVSATNPIIDCSSFGAGVYFISLDTGTKVTHSKIVIN